MNPGPTPDPPTRRGSSPTDPCRRPPRAGPEDVWRPRAATPHRRAGAGLPFLGGVPTPAELYRAFKGLTARARRIVGAVICGESGGICKKLFSRKDRDSIDWLAGALIGGVFIVPDIRDLVLAIKNGKLTAAGLSAAGIVPVFGDVARGAKFVSRVALREDDLAEVNKPIDTHWGKLRGARRAEALGIGSALKQLEDLPRIKILCDGRPKAGRPIRDRTPFAVPNGKPIIVEAKGTLLRRQAALSRKALTTPLTVRGQKVSFLQPSAAAIGSDRYARSLDVAPALYLLGERRQLAELLRRHPGEERLIQALEAATDTLRDRDEPHGPWAADTLEELFAA